MLKKLLAGKSRGFTLIEVVIVLAIAGLIFVVVFLAVSQAQAGRRDTARKSDAQRLIAGINQWSSNNAGTLPTLAQVNNPVIGTYVTPFTDPGSSVAYTAVAAVPVQNQMRYRATDCAGGATRAFSVTTWLERGGSACFDN